ncbi:hypothetical protein OIU76_004229 [Salix suchowensis]|nr:hypothetical protein OIU76_004229 [Salix suchowensis]
MNLTEGAISKITSGGATSAELKPTLQVTDLKQVQTKQPQQSDRFRLVLSDGSHLQQAMLGTQINHLVKDGNLRIGSIVQLNQYTCTTVQGRMIIIILELALVAEGCELIGNPVSAQKSSGPSPSQGAQPGNVNASPKSFTGGVVGNQNISAAPVQSPEINQFHNTLPSSNFGPGRNCTASYGKLFPPPQSAYQQPPPMYSNRGPVAKNEAPPRIVPITALNPYQGRWTIKARVTAKGELRHYNNTRGDGKVFSFDLLDSDGGEIRVTCFNQVADQFYHQIESGRVYLISKGNLKPAQKNFNHLRHDLEIFLESTSTIQPCFEDDNTIPQLQFHFRPISDVEDMENNSVVDIIGVDMSGRSVELTLWGNFCNSEGQRLQHICDSGGFPVLAVKSGRVSEFNGKAVGTISTSQLFIEPDSPEASRLKQWFDREGRNTPSLSISRETSTMGRSDVMKTISQIKDERLGTSEKPDWITVPATVIYVKSDNFCYTACPIMSGERQCNKKVTNNGDGKWQCEKCDRSVDECDYRYILQLQIQDHTGITWVTAFQECGEEIMGISAKDLHYLKHEQQDDEGFSKVLRQVLFSRYVFKLKIKEETFSDEQRVKSTVVKSEKQKSSYHNPGLNNAVIGNFGSRQAGPPGSNPVGSSSYAGNVGLPANQLGQYGNQQNPMFPMQSSSGAYLSCNSCGATVGHWARDCPGLSSSGRMGGVSKQQVMGFSLFNICKGCGFCVSLARAESGSSMASS